MHFRTRALAYAGAGAVGLFATGLFAAPALAADEADVSVKAVSSKIAIGAGLKLFRYDVKNAGPSVAAATQVAIDLSGLDPKQVTIDVDELEEADRVDVVKAEADEVVLDLGDLASGETWAIPLPLFVAEGAEPGPAGTFKLTIKSAVADPAAGNNVSSVPVEVTKSGVDLLSVASDVYAFGEEGDEELKPVPPGGEGALPWIVLNQGDQGSQGLRVGVTLPEKVSFIEDYEGCTISGDRRVLLCQDSEAVLAPGDAFGGVFPVKVSKDASGPVTLTGGTLKVGGFSAIESPSPAARAATASKVFDQFTEKAEEVLADIDPADNDSEFSVFVGGTGGGGGGDLPVTGVQAGLIGGVGLAVLAGGGVLLVMSRRRKVVLVTPGDETPTA
ncbi:hypothetical protein [Micromonospora sp. CPCC 206061]|uniref:hypothetical protein n=1 Tax=Micromonospora sp. CPCC 206061 TaxID=3122410 RepID=UPI002FEF10C8